MRNYSRKIDTLILILLGCSWGIVPLVYLPYMYEKSSGMEDCIYKPKLYLLLIILLVLLVCIVIRNQKEVHFFRWRPMLVPLGCYLVFIILSTAFSPYQDIVWWGKPYRWEGFITLYLYILLFLTTYSFVKNKKRLDTLLWILIISASMISIYGMMQYFGWDPIPRDPIREHWSNRAFSTLGNPNFVGSYVGMMFSLTLVLYLQSRNKRIILWGGAVLLFFALSLATGTRGLWLTLLVIVPMGIRMTFRKQKEYLMKIGIIVILAFLIFISLEQQEESNLRQRISSVGEDIQMIVEGTEEQRNRVGSNRIYIYRTSWPLLWERPLLGSGPDTFHRVYPQELHEEYTGQGALIDKAHNEYLQIGITLGIPALISYLVFLFMIFRENIRALKMKNPYQMGLFLSILAYWIQANFNISVVSVAPVYWMLLGCNLASLQK